MVWCGWLHFVDLPWRQEGSPKMGSKILFQRDKSMFFIQQELHPKIFEDVGSQHLPIDGCHLFFKVAGFLSIFQGFKWCMFFSTCFSQCFLRGSYSSYVPTTPQRFVLYEDHMSSLAMLEWWKICIYIYIFNLQQKLHSLKLT